MILSIIIITVVISLVASNNSELFYRFKFNPFLIKQANQWYRFFTYGFLHAGTIHLIINMFVLYSFGSAVIEYYKYFFGIKGAYYLIILYVGSLITCVLPAYGKHKNNPSYNAVGASGAVSAVVFTAIIFNPLGKIYLFFIPIGIPSFIFGILYLVYSAYMSKKGRDNIGHDAHFWGAVFGIIFTIALKPILAVYFYKQIINYFL